MYVTCTMLQTKLTYLLYRTNMSYNMLLHYTNVLFLLFLLLPLLIGLFVSPHIASYRERIQINNILISESSILQHLPIVLQYCIQYSIPATLFEITFILSCIYFAHEQCDAVVLEVGLGDVYYIYCIHTLFLCIEPIYEHNSIYIYRRWG